jgi:hypothetical protein
MSDMDLLVPEKQIREAERLLMMEGYVDDPKDRRHLDVGPASARHSHIASLMHLKRNVTVELHYKVAYGQTGRILPVEAARAATVSGTFRGHAVSWLSPHHRLLHNALHATLPHREFWQGKLRLSDLAEFAALLERYPEEVALDRFWKVIRRNNLGTEIGTYALLARLLMRSVLKAREIRENSWHRDRLLQSSPPALDPAGRLSKTRRIGWRVVSFIYDKRHLPAWTWRNVCYGDDRTPSLARLGCIGRMLLNPRTLQNIFGKTN